MIGRLIRRPGKADIVVEDVEKFINRLEDVLPVGDDENALVEVARWHVLVEKVIKITEEKMNIDEKIDAMSIVHFLAAKEIEFLYRNVIKDIAETVIDADEDVENLTDRRISKKIKQLALLTGRRVDEVIDDIEIEIMKKRKGGKCK